MSVRAGGEVPLVVCLLLDALIVLLIFDNSWLAGRLMLVIPIVFLAFLHELAGPLRFPGLKHSIVRTLRYYGGAVLCWLGMIAASIAFPNRGTLDLEIPFLFLFPALVSGALLIYGLCCHVSCLAYGIMACNAFLCRNASDKEVPTSVA